MNCIYCGAELENQGPWGYLASHQSGEVLGHTFKCPNSDGFKNEEEANADFERYESTWQEEGYNHWSEAACFSSTHHVSGSFYTDKQGNIHDGYPC